MTWPTEKSFRLLVSHGFCHVLQETSSRSWLFTLMEVMNLSRDNEKLFFSLTVTEVNIGPSCLKPQTFQTFCLWNNKEKMNFVSVVQQHCFRRSGNTSFRVLNRFTAVPLTSFSNRKNWHLKGFISENWRKACFHSVLFQMRWGDLRESDHAHLGDRKCVWA